MYNPLLSLLPLLTLTTLTQAWLPTKDAGVIRGVNLGGLFIMEPWMQWSQWSSMGCGAYQSEFDCVMNMGQAKANAAFQNHWATWISEPDFQEMVSYGINTVRIPVGYWMLESLVYADSEHFPQGGLPHLENILKLAKKYNLYVILDLHGAPGAQIPKNAFTGQYAPAAGFYVDYQYNRAIQFLTFLAQQIYTNPTVYGAIGMIELLNEPLTYTPEVTATLITQFYPQAWKAVRNYETALNIPKSKRLHIMFMDDLWGSGNPTANLPDTDMSAFDYHKYVKWDTSVTPTRDSYMEYSCNADLGCKKPLVVGEWSLSVPDNLQESDMFRTDSADAVKWFSGWFVAQQQMYERSGSGWVFWSWKSTLGDWRWSYRDAVVAGVIPKTLTASAKWNVCGAYKKAKREQVVGDVVEIPALALEKKEAVVDQAPAPSGKVEVNIRSHAARHAKWRRMHGHSLSHMHHS
ncbi:hypothetical protein TWF694_000330 [Orbilia ellipsospora]|uniref:glucan 1,3-beta-glucosidase n=1 Tax=Orbilia ellipsospora TaxID=2528407 RepID=A0AAV9XNA4_9PEZI